MGESKQLPQLHCHQCTEEDGNEEGSVIVGKAVLISPTQDLQDENSEHFIFHINCFKVWMDQIVQQEQKIWLFEMSIAPVGDIAAGLFTSSDDEL